MNYSISTNPSDFDFETIYKYLSNSYWAKDIPRTTLKKAIEHSLCFAVLADDNKQVGFARLITDKATFAYLADVFIIEKHRGKGLSKQLIKAIIEHPELQGLRRMVLATKDAHGLYQQFGFKAIAQPEIFMEVWDPEVYQNS
ncbi:GNAT family N-acetyltransferase [Thalassotalea atypica]|uniref:GNAT family N-acetyltransferase n=1 Tax=Thalassotalea atypica TaxID=2054316 RepID=UPI00257440FD|nr:GNAT family N-acetyltransferase [Thalassotalea atypica]